MYDLFRRGEVLPEGRTNQEEAALIEHQMIEAAKKALAAGANGQSQMVDGKTNGAATGSALPA
jgi:hypothetical protein